MDLNAQEVKGLISEIMGIEAASIKDDSHFKDDLGMDSIAIADLISSLEEDHDILIGHEDAIQLKNFGLLMKFIQEYE